jgi:hypothetical protein
MTEDWTTLCDPAWLAGMATTLTFTKLLPNHRRVPLERMYEPETRTFKAKANSTDKRRIDS